MSCGGFSYHGQSTVDVCLTLCGCTSCRVRWRILQEQWQSWPELVGKVSGRPHGGVIRVTYLSTMAYQITDNLHVCSIICSDQQERKHRISTWWVICAGKPGWRRPVDSLSKCQLYMILVTSASSPFCEGSSSNKKRTLNIHTEKL